MVKLIIFIASLALAFVAGFRIGQTVEPLGLAVLCIAGVAVLIILCGEIIASCWD